jgi:hypothetical protein
MASIFADRQKRLKAIRMRHLGLCSALVVAAVTGAGVLIPAAQSSATTGGFNRPGNILIADQFNNRVIEVNQNGKILWHFGTGPNDCSPHSIVGTNDTQRVGDLTLMAGTGIPPGLPLSITPFTAGCVDNRVLLVNEDGKIVWRYGTFGVSGAGPNQLNVPVQDTALPNGHILITDQSNERVIEVKPSKTGVGGAIVWQYGDGTANNGPNELNNPNAAELLPDGHVLISDENNNRAIEVIPNRKTGMGGTIVDTISGTVNGIMISGVAFASRLPNGDTLLTDSNNNRILEVNEDHNFVWQYITNTQVGSNASPLPTRAVRLQNGNTLISDQFNDRVIEVTHGGKTVLQLGSLNVQGFGTASTQQGLGAPYDAKVIGDYTGLTPPFGFADNEGG